MYVNASHMGSLDKGKHFFQWGNSIERQIVNDHFHEWIYNDSAGYSLPYNPGQLSLQDAANNNADFRLTRFRDIFRIIFDSQDSTGFILQAGVRYNYNTLNKEFLVSPRIGFSFKPGNWKRDIIFRGSVGIYDQPPFYREMRRYDGSDQLRFKSAKKFSNNRQC